MGLLTQRKNFKPFEYTWAFEAWKMQQQTHWLPEEVPMSDDIRDWKNKLTTAEKNLCTQIFKLFTVLSASHSSNLLCYYMGRNSENQRKYRFLTCFHR